MPSRPIRCLLAVLPIVLGGCGAAVFSSPPADPVAVADAQRGRLLYGTQCIGCHTTQAHWRDKSIVQSWPGLVSQVSRWQQNAGLGWSNSEILDVAAYLNGMFYRLDCPMMGCSGAPSRAEL